MDTDHAFILMPASKTGVSFANDLRYDARLNTYTYRNFYNGAGVALGDINNDGLLDIYFSGNQVENKLYLNQGDFSFEDITAQAGVACRNVWSTGVSMADVNGDGLLDIFVCKSGPPMGGVRHNELFINNGDLTFTESAAAWGVADEGLSIHAVFFDYDKDGDLDFYLLNNSNRSVGIYDLKEGQRELRDPFGGNKLYRNDGNRFTDVSEAAGIYGSAIGFGLGVTAADINRDGWPDLFVSNDFFERDYLYLNNQDGTFTESLEVMINEISMGSMGADIADLNNDGYPEIYVTEMLPEPLERVRTKTLFEDWDKYSANVKSGYYHQFTRNVLQLNNGPIPGNEKWVSFSEVSRFAGVHATDWSWGALIFDYNNDGLKDIFVANGIAKDLTDQDYINFEASTMLTAANLRKDSMLLVKLIDKIPVEPISNYMFENAGNMRFNNRSTELGLALPGFSNGAAYGDLDNDGALDLVISNINAPASIYRNNTLTSSGNHYLQMQLTGIGNNRFGFGTQVSAYCAGQLYYAEQSPVKGYLSSVDPKLHIGLGQHTVVDSLVIKWPEGKITRLKNVPADQLLKLDESSLTKEEYPMADPNRNYLLTGYISQLKSWVHAGSTFNDFNRDRLLFEMCTNEGPGIAIADVNGDGLEDIFIGGSVNQESVLWFQTASGDFTQSHQPAFIEDLRSDDVCALFFDANGDGHPDLYVGSGGHQYSFGAIEYQDRLYTNDGKGKFIRSRSITGPMDARESTSFALSIDFNKDGREDLIVGSRLIPFYYGQPANVYLLRNEGRGVFTDVTPEYAKGFLGLGMTRGAALLDYDKDGDQDVVIVGEWMSVKLFQNTNGYFTDVSTKLGFDYTEGLWNTVVIGDFNDDGYPDIAAGNYGLNSRYHASGRQPLVMYVHDFDGNGRQEQIICQRIGDQDYPLALLPDLWKQLPMVKKNFASFEAYKNASIIDLFTEAQRERARVLQVHRLESGIFYNQQGTKFTFEPFPDEAQITRQYALLPVDIDHDSILDLILGGNQRRVKPEWGIQDGGYGHVLKGLHGGGFENLKMYQSGLYIRGEIRQLRTVITKRAHVLVATRFNDSPVLFKIED
jgi:enediyne biosynthesis protein E4